MAVPGWFGPVGGALTEAATAYTGALLDLPEDTLQRRKKELELEQLEARTGLEQARTEGERKKAAGGQPIETNWGLYTIDPATGRYRLELPRPEQPRKPFAKEAELELMHEWTISDDPYKRDIATSYLEKQQAPARGVEIRSRQADAQIDHLKRQQGYWQQRADEARRHNSAMEQVYRDRAKQVSGELGSLMQAQEWLRSGTPEQQQAAGRYLQGKDVVIEREKRQGDLQPGKVEKQALDIDTAGEKLEQLRTRSQSLDQKLREDLDYRTEQVKQLKARGLHLGPYLEAQIRRLEEQILSSQQRRTTPGGGSGSEVTVSRGPTGPSSRYRGADVQTYNQAFVDGIERLAPLSEADATAEVSRQPPGPKRDGAIEAWRAKFPGKVFRPTPNVVPMPEPRRPTRQGARDRQSALGQPATALDTRAQERYGKTYLELDEDQKQEIEAAGAQQPTTEVPTPIPKTSAALPKPGSPEHRYYKTYQTEMVDKPHEQVIEAWQAVKTSGTAAEKLAFQRAYHETFGGEVR